MSFASAKPTNGSKIISKSPLSADEAKWARLTKINWQDPSGKSRVWESAERTTRSKRGIDGNLHSFASIVGQTNTYVLAVGIIAILKEEDGPKIVLGKQYRPPCETMCIEVPAGTCEE
jgi:ADP-ribose pyrophosphatase